MRRARHADHAERVARHVGRDRERAADGDGAGGNAADDGARREAAVVRVEVGRVVDLRVEVVGGAIAAQAAAAVDHGSVGHEERGGVVVARDGDRGHFAEGVGGRVEDFRGVLGRVVGEWNGGDLAADDQDGAVGEDDPVGKGASVGHGVDGCNGGSGRGGAKRDDVGVTGGVGILVVWRSTSSEDVSSNCIVHDGVAAHGVGIPIAGPRSGLTPSSSGRIPIHSRRRPTLEDVAVTPAEQPGVVISAIDT